MILRRRLLLVISVLSALQLVIAEDCVKEIVEDICPQREGFDADCERRCMQQFPLRISSGCVVRSTGTLLSFFGIRSFACRCILPPSYCDASAVLNAFSPARLSFSLPAIQAHSTIERLSLDQSCPLSPSPFDLSCSSSFSNCGWHRSQGADWFSAKEHGILPFGPHEAPTGEYLVAVSKEGFTSISLDTCPGLCSKEDVNVTVRVWRAPWVVVELCFREEGETMCTPLKTPNGQKITEVMPQTDSFSITFRFSNMTVGDAVMVDDLSTLFEPCPLAQRMGGNRMSQLISPTPLSHISSLPSSSASSPFRASMQPSKLQPMAPAPPSPPAPAVQQPQPLPSLAGMPQFPLLPMGHMPTQSLLGPPQPPPASLLAQLPFMPFPPPPPPPSLAGISRFVLTTTESPFSPPTTPSPLSRPLSPDQQSFIPIGSLPGPAHSRFGLPPSPGFGQPSLPEEATTSAAAAAAAARFVPTTVREERRRQEGAGVMLPEVRTRPAHTASAVRTMSGVGGSTNCKDGDCRPSSLDRTCIGRAAAIKCQAKCRDQGNGGLTARCIREKEYPFSRRCVCQKRRAPTVVDHRVNEVEDEVSSLRHHPSSPISSTLPSIEGEALLKGLIKHQPSSSTSPSSRVEDVRFRSEGETSAELRRNRLKSSSHDLPAPSETSIEQFLSLNEEESSLESRLDNLLEATIPCERQADCEGQCEDDSTPECRENECVCSKCAKHICDFEKRGECGWSDLRALSAQFNNISVASKKGQDNRYGLSRMAPRSYSGLLRRASISGPIALSIDLFPSHNMDVKICVHTLQTCQSQKVEARAWNRVTAKIKMKSTDKIFLLFYNKSAIDKTIAIDNIQLESGDCTSIPPKAVRRRRV